MRNIIVCLVRILVLRLICGQDLITQDREWPTEIFDAEHVTENFETASVITDSYLEVEPVMDEGNVAPYLVFENKFTASDLATDENSLLHMNDEEETVTEEIRTIEESGKKLFSEEMETPIGPLQNSFNKIRNSDENPFEYQYREIVLNSLDPYGKLNNQSEEMFKRENKLDFFYPRDKLEIKDIQKLSSLPYKDIISYDAIIFEDLYICYVTSNKEVFVSLELKEKKLISRSGIGPCHFAKHKDELFLIYMSKDSTNRNLVISKLNEKTSNFQEIQRGFIIREKSSRIVSWEQGGSLYLLVTGVQSQDTFSYSSHSGIYVYKDGLFVFSQKLSGFSPGKPNHFKIGYNHFLAMPNYVNNKGLENVGTQVYKYSVSLQQYILFQNLETPAATYVSSFTNDEGKTFVIVTNFYSNDIGLYNQNSTTILEFQEGKFSPIQFISSSGAIESNVIKFKNEVFLLILNAYGGISVYQYENSFFKTNPHLDIELTRDGLTNLIHIEKDSEVYLGTLSSWQEFGSELNLFRLNFNKDTKIIPSYDALSRWCYEAIVSITSRVESIKKQIEKVPLKNKPVVFTDRIKVQNLQIDSNISVPVFNNKTYNHFKARLEREERGLDYLVKNMAVIEDRISKAININETTEWPDNLRMSSVVILEAKTKSFTAENVNDVLVPSIKELIPFSNASLQLDLNTKTFSDIEIKQNLNVKNLNGYPLSSYVTLNGDHAMKGHITFNKIKTPRMKIGGKINDIEISRDNLLLRRSKSFTGSLECSEVTVSNLETDTINGINMKELMRGTTSYESSFVVKGDLTISGNLIYSGNLKIGSLSGRNLEHFANDTISLESIHPQIITGKYSIKNMRTPDIHLPGTLNNIPFWDSVFVNLPYKIYHVSKARFDTLQANYTYVQKSLNEIMVFDRKLDLITLDGDQVVSGKKVFSELHLKNSLVYKETSLNSKFSYVPVSNESSSTSKMYKTTTKTREAVHSENILLKYLRIIRTILMKIMDTKPKTIYPSNYYDVDIDPLTNATMSNILSTLISINSELENNNIMALSNIISNFSSIEIIRLNEIRGLKVVSISVFSKIEELYSTLADTLNRIKTVITNKKNLVSTLQTNINVFNQMMRQEVENLNKVEIASKGSFVNGLIAGYDLRKIPSVVKTNLNALNNNDILTKVMNADWVIFMDNFITPSINTVNMKRLLEQSVPISSTDTNLNLTFTEEVSIQKDFSSPLINGFVANSFARTTGTNVFESEIEFRDVRFGSNVQSKGKVNGYNFKKIVSQIATVNGSQKFTKPVSFSSITTNSVNASNVILNGVPLEDYVLKSNKDILITGKKRYKNIIVEDPLVRIHHLVSKEVGNIPLPDSSFDTRILSKDLKIDGQTELESLLVKGNANTPRNILSSEDFNAFNLTRLYENAVQHDGDGVISGSLALEGNVNVNEFIFKRSFNGVRAEEFSNGLVMQSETQTLQETTIFQNLHVKNLLIKNKLLQGVDLEKLVNGTAKIDEDSSFSEKVFSGRIISQQPIVVSGLVQGWNLTRDAILHSDSPIISGPKKFDVVTVRNNINVNGLANGIDIGKTCKSIMGEVRIVGPVHFGKDVNADRVHSGEISLPNDLSSYWMRSQPTNISSDMFFNVIEANGIYINNKFNMEPMWTIMEGPFPLSCDDATLKKWNINKLICNDLDAKRLKVDLLGNEDSGILDKIILDTVDQTFTDDLNVGSDLEANETSVLGKINGFQMTDFCYKNIPCRVEAPKKFLNSVNVINDWNISDESRINNITVHEIKNLGSPGPMTVIVNDSVHANSLNVDGFVNGIKFDSNTIMSLSKKQSMNGSLWISNNGELAFNAVNAKIMNEMFNGLNVSSVKPKRVNSALEILDDGQFDDMVKQFIKLEKSVFRVYAILLDQQIRFDGWNVHEEFKDFEKVVLLEDEKSTLYIIALLSPEGIRIKNYIPHSKTYNDYAFIDVKCPTDVKSFRMDNELFVAASVECTNPDLNLNGTVMVSPESIGAEENVFSYMWKVTSNGHSLYAAIATGKANQILCFQMSGRNCIIFVTQNNAKQNILCENKGSLILQQSLGLENVIKALHLKVEATQESLIIVGSKKNTLAPNYVKVLKFHPESDHFETLQKIQTDGLISICATDFEEGLFLATIQGPFRGSTRGEINIYKYGLGFKGSNNQLNPETRFVLEESIYVDDPVEATFLKSPSSDLFLLVLDKHGFILRYVKKGYEKFQKVGSFQSPDVHSLTSWFWKRAQSYNFALSRKSLDQKSKVTILKPLYRGWSEI